MNTANFSKSFHVYLVGGAVRDMLLHRTPKDRDWVIVGATPEDVSKLKTQGYSQVGADFPVFLHPKTNEEYALARVERKVSPGYLGFVVQADAQVTIEADLARRDLTINSMAFDHLNGKVIDPYGGLSDLHNHILRHTSPAFAEDPLRVLRLARFAARFSNFEVAAETIELCKSITATGELNALSVERIWTELEKGLLEEYPERFLDVLDRTNALQNCKLLSRLFGEHFTDQQRRIAKNLSTVTEDGARLPIAIAALSLTPWYLNKSQLTGASRRVLDCYKNVHLLKCTTKDAQSLNNLLRTAGALHTGSGTYHDLVRASIVLELGGENLAFSHQQLLMAGRLARSIRASDFENLHGKELGLAIDAKRQEGLQMSFRIPSTHHE